MSPEKNPSYLDTVEAMRRFERLRPQAEKNKQQDALRDILPQGHGSGLNADMVDGLHAEDFLKEIRSRPAAKMVGGGGGGTVWYDGVVAPAGFGVDGDYYLDTVAGDVYLNTGGVWGVVGNILGGGGGLTYPQVLSVAYLNL